MVWAAAAAEVTKLSTQLRDFSVFGGEENLNFLLEKSAIISEDEI